MKTDARVRYTRMMIQQTFLDLLKKKPISKITVKEICDIAQINRATFYKHYQDPYDLLEQFQNEAIQGLLDMIEASSEKSTEQILLSILTIMKENKDICEATSNLEDVCADEELQRFIQYKEKQEHDWASYREQSIKEGLEKGIEKGQKEIITNMLNSGMSLEQISNITKLSIDKLKHLSAHK